MNTHCPARRRLTAAAFAVVFLVVLVSLSGCSTVLDIVEPRSMSLEDARTSLEIQAPLPPLDRWEGPRITIRSDGWRRAPKETGVWLDPERILDLEVSDGQPVTFEWSARPRDGRGEVLGYRWALDIEDLVDPTPRSGPADLAHWSDWSATEQSATIGPYDAGASHLFYVEALDNLGFVTLVTVRVTVASAVEAPLVER